MFLLGDYRDTTKDTFISSIATGYANRVSGDAYPSLFYAYARLIVHGSGRLPGCIIRHQRERKMVERERTEGERERGRSSTKLSNTTKR